MIAQRYAASPPEIKDVLAQKILHGGAGSWGQVPMVSNPHVTVDEARAIVTWILAH